MNPHHRISCVYNSLARACPLRYFFFFSQPYFSTPNAEVGVRDARYQMGTMK